MGCPKLTYNLSAEPRLRCVYNADDGEEGHVAYPSSNASGVAVATNSYDAWGRLRNPTTLVPFAHNAQPTLTLRRGYTGHEHLPEFGLINMNARLYDPVIGRMLTPDPFVQAPNFSQSYNRYSYCLNNPLSYSDPSGEKWKWWHWALFFLDPVTATTTIATAAFTAASSYAGIAATTFATALPKMNNAFWAGLVSDLKYHNGDGFKGDFSWNNGVQRAKNAWRISMGLLKTDRDKSFLNRTWQVLSRHSWQQPMTSIGYELSNVANNYFQLDGVEHFHGATVLLTNRFTGKQAVSVGSYIGIKSNSDISFNNPTLLHEYGHFLQTRQWGGMATLHPSFFSLLSAGLEWRSTVNHSDTWFERDANFRALRYFENKMEERQIENFKDTHPITNYDARFFGSLFLFLYPFWDITWSN